MSQTLNDSSVPPATPGFGLGDLRPLYNWDRSRDYNDHSADIKISGAVSMDDEGNPTAVGDLEQQIKNAYSDLGKVLEHHGDSFDDVVVENVFTTDMAKFLDVAGYRNTIYTQQFPAGTWLEVKGVALPEFMIDIELEAHKSG